MNKARFLAILRELTDENPFAIRAVLRILNVAFTKQIPTLAVTCQARPQLLVNLEFVAKHCLTDAHVKAVLCHEFLHVLLRHTEKPGKLSRARHIAFDAVINAIISREHGEAYSSFFSHYYADEQGLTKLLRPMTKAEQKASWYQGAPPFARVWQGLYDGRLVADDIEELADDISAAAANNLLPFDLAADLVEGHGDLIGNHDDVGSLLSPELSEAINKALRELNGAGIWRSPRSRGVGVNVCDALIDAANLPLKRWEAATLAVLRRHLAPSRQASALEDRHRDFNIPVLSQSDRRAFIRTLWDPVLPQAVWSGSIRQPRATAHVYLDVSGSMSAEMPPLVALLGRLSSHIRRPFWAFSDHVAPACIQQGQLKTSTTGGTSMACVLDHIEQARPLAAVIITDGFIERLSSSAVRRKLGDTRLHAIISRRGSGAELLQADIPYTQLEHLPR